MKILYLSSLMSTESFDAFYETSKIKPTQEAQKYHKLMVSGLSKQDCKVTVLTAIPTSRAINNRLFWGFKKEVGDVDYVSIPFINLPIIRQLCILFFAFFYCLIFLNKEKAALVCDVLNISLSFSGLLAAKLLKSRSVGIVTDVPAFMVYDNRQTNSKIKRIIRKVVVPINNSVINLCWGYVFLTEQTNTLINKKHKPYVILEGQVDYLMQVSSNNLAEKYDSLVCMYTGSLKEQYGIGNLVEAFIKADVPYSELHIYGSGDYADKLTEISSEHGNIKYFGTVPNKIVVSEQLKATLLINPRPIGEEFTKYSFPSKNMEYMVSGTPILTTKLPGIPEEYNEYIYTFYEDNPCDMAQTLKVLLSKSRDELHYKGELGKKFVLDNKSNIKQASKIVCMLVK